MVYWGQNFGKELRSVGAFLKKYRQPLDYLFWGGCTTLVNFVVYFLFTRVIPLDIVIANILAWCAAVLFAFFVNKILVFHSGSWKWKLLFPEFVKFIGARVVSLVMETVLLWLCVDVAHLNDFIMKILISVLVVISNYVFSKLYIYKRKES